MYSNTKPYMYNNTKPYMYNNTKPYVQQYKTIYTHYNTSFVPHASINWYKWFPNCAAYIPFAWPHSQISPRLLFFTIWTDQRWSMVWDWSYHWYVQLPSHTHSPKHTRTIKEVVTYLHPQTFLPQHACCLHYQQ